MSHAQLVKVSFSLSRYVIADGAVAGKERELRVEGFSSGLQMHGASPRLDKDRRGYLIMRLYSLGGCGWVGVRVWKEGWLFGVNRNGRELCLVLIVEPAARLRRVSELSPRVDSEALRAWRYRGWLCIGRSDYRGLCRPPLLSQCVESLLHDCCCVAILRFSSVAMLSNRCFAVTKLNKQELYLC